MKNFFRIIKKYKEKKLDKEVFLNFSKKVKNKLKDNIHSLKKFYIDEKIYKEIKIITFLNLIVNKLKFQIF